MATGVGGRVGLGKSEFTGVLGFLLGGCVGGVTPLQILQER